MTDKVVVLSSCGSSEEAEALARHLVEQRLAACVSVVGKARSFYWWQGKIEESGEWMLVIKTARGTVERLREALSAMHSYQTPEVIALPIVDGSTAYLEWMERELELPKPDPS
ncbi:MAG: divalent-cation tolerance protein CutA [Bryobacteraceae bacterium]